MVEADPNQADPALFHTVQQIYRLTPDGNCGIACDRASGSGDAFHIRIRQLQRDAASAQAYSFRTILHVQCKKEQHILQKFVVINILLKGQLPANGFGFFRPIRFHPPVVDSKSNTGNPTPLLAQQADDVFLSLLNIPHSTDPGSIELFGSAVPNQVKDFYIPVYDQIDKLLRAEYFKVSVRFLFFAGCLGSRLGICHTNRAGQVQFLPCSAFDSMGDLPCAVPCAGFLCYIKICFIQRNRFRNGCISVPDCMKPGRRCFVLVKIRMHIGSTGAQAIGILDIHAGVNTVFPCFIAAGSNHSPFIGE